MRRMTIWILAILMGACNSLTGILDLQFSDDTGGDGDADTDTDTDTDTEPDTDSDKGPAFVYGRGSVNPGGRDDSIHGTLAKSSGTDYYGECRYANGEFSFTVAHAKLENLSGTLTADTPIFLRFSGIKGAQANDGAPNDGVFDPATGQPWYRTEYHGSFARATVASGGEVFNFTSSEGGCRVELFATPISGELIRDINKSFDYYVRINCAGMSEVKGTNNPSVSLLTVEADFYFDNC